MTSGNTEAAGDDAEASGAARRAEYRAGWDARLVPVLTADWRSADAIADQLDAPKSIVLARLKDMATRNLAERRVVKIVPKSTKKRVKRPRIHTARFEAQFRLPVIPGDS